MKPKLFLFFLAAGLVVVPKGSARAQAAPSFQVVASFDYPGASFLNVFKIDDAGAIAGGVTIDSVRSGVVWFPGGNTSKLLPAPGGSTDSYLTAANDPRNYCGNYFAGNGGSRASVVIGGVKNEISIPTATENYVWDMNGADDFCGSYYYNGGGSVGGYVSVGGTIRTLQATPASFITSVEGLNNLGQAVGYYREVEKTSFGFLRDADGTVTASLGIAGDIETYLKDINDAGLIVGFASDGRHYHGVYFAPGGVSGILKYPGATDTFIYGVNTEGLISGEYSDNTGEHGFIARTKL